MSLRHKTHKGRNRIDRGGKRWLVLAHADHGFLLESVEKGNREMFWDQLDGSGTVWIA